MTDKIVNADRLPGWLLIAYLILVISLAANILPWQFDDAYITYRYAANVIDHGSLSFNVGGEHVEGMTGTLWFWLLVVVGAVVGTQHMPAVAVFLGITMLSLSTAMAWRILKAMAGPWAALVTLVAMLSLPSVSFFTVTGMDQIVFSVLVMLVGLYLAGYWEGRWLAAGLVFLAVWSRPEAPVIAVMIGLSLLWPGKVRTLVSIWPSLMALVVGMASLVLYRYLVFGDVLPNTFYAKPGDISQGWQYVLDAFRQSDWLSFLGIMAMVAAWFGDGRHRCMVSFALIWVLVPVAEGGDWMAMYRFLLPAMLLLSMTLPGLFNMRWKIVRALLVISLAFLPYQGFAIIQTTQTMLDISYMSKGVLTGALQQWIDANRLQRIALMDIGRIGYGKPYHIIDLGGLTDRYIAHLPGKHMQKPVPAGYLLEQGADAVLLRVQVDLMVQPAAEITSGMIDPGTERQLFDDPGFQALYEPVMVIREAALQVDVPDQYLVFVRRGLGVTPAPLPFIERKGYRMVVYPALWGAAIR